MRPWGHKWGLSSSYWTQLGREVPPSRGRPGPPAFGCSSWLGRWLEGQGQRLHRSNLGPLLPYGITKRPLVLGACPGLAHPSSLTIVKLSSWPQGARPEIGCLVPCGDKGVWDLLSLPHPQELPPPTQLPWEETGLTGGWEGVPEDLPARPWPRVSAGHRPFPPPGTKLNSPLRALCRGCLPDSELQELQLQGGMG